MEAWPGLPHPLFSLDFLCNVALFFRAIFYRLCNVMQPENESCATCKYWLPNPRNKPIILAKITDRRLPVGVCRRYPPPPQGFWQKGVPVETNIMQWCGEWSNKPGYPGDSAVTRPEKAAG
ncbi:hypothetical protein [Nitratireductor sp. XY-223]|uniref:hypothetical protein n=1 Tax=Nitratireductor sp. XY-223 TaxID=2561926 RepID=UPI0010A9F2D0|nr:hypothetical protein [Nitratireductor sp. XY-223]